MVWDRRVQLVSSGAGIVAMLAVGAWYMAHLAPPSKTFSLSPTTLVHPILDQPLLGFDGQPLVTQRRIPALVVVPGQLPKWAQQDLKDQVTPSLMKQKQLLWDGSSSLFAKARKWSVSGLYPVTLLAWVPVTGVSSQLIEAWGKSRGDYSTGPVMPRNGVFRSTVPVHAARLAWSTRLSQQLLPLVKSGGSLAVIDGSGRIRTLLASPNHRGIAWEPRPVGLGLVPPLTAEALGSQGILLKIKGTGDLLGQLAGAWGSRHISQGLKRLGLGSKTTLIGQPVKNPPLPRPSTSVMSQGRALWATPLEIGRAYLPFIRQGLLPQLTASAVPSPLRVHGVPLVSAAVDLNQVASVLPMVMVDGVKFFVWRPDGNYAVAFTQDDGGVVLVTAGPATQSIVDLVHVLAGWMHQSPVAKKQGNAR